MFRLLRSATLASLLALPAAALADEATINVTTLVDAVTGDGLCSLREAIETVNTESPVDGCTIEGSGEPVVLLGEGVHRLTIEGPHEEYNASSDLYVRKPVTVRGAGAGLTTIDAGGLFRVLSVASNARLAIEQVKLTGGNAGPQPGGAINAYYGELEVSDAIIENNTAERGGAIYAVLSRLVMRRTLVQGNSTASAGGGIELTGGETEFPSLIESSTVAGNTSGLAGGLYNAAVVHLRQTTFSANTATGSGPGAAVFNQGTMSLDAVLVTGTVGEGSAVFNNGGKPAILVNNSAFAHNSQPISGEFESHGGNYIEAAWAPFATADDLVVPPGQGAALRDLGDYSGPTPVRPPRLGSLLIGLASCVDLDGVPYGVDQRGAPRASTGCTSGPVEHGALGLVTRAAIATADQCSHGGVVVHSGEDDGYLDGVAGDRLLSDGEIEITDVSCHAPGALVSVSDEAPGDHCEAGGQRIDTGLDVDASGSLDEGEIEQTRYVCNPPPPAPVLFDVVDFDSSEKCMAGGQRLVTGVDANRNGTLEVEEIASAVETCHGVDGTDGTDGQDGTDGTDGEDGATGPKGEDGAPGKDGLDGKDGKDGMDAEGGCASAGVGSLALLALGLRRRRVVVID